ncbi:hypothetical protein HDU76_003913 [Blyttiomyces sp. JEL0837]|nr:hypothetical protein HDU76_003913 [Blyttiomyces sp. JEL0837]
MIFANVSSIDTIVGSFNLHFLFQPCGKFALKDDKQNRFNLGVPLNVTIDSVIYKFPSNTPMSSQDFTAKFSSGDPNSYPFEFYDSPTLEITASTLTPSTSPNSSLIYTPIPLQVSIVGALQTYTISLPSIYDHSLAMDGSLIDFQVRVGRSFTTKLFSLFVMFVMWGLSLLTFAVGLTPWIRRYRIEAPTLAIANTLLFALPALRNSQPGAPPIGATADVVSFFWCEMLTATSSALMLLNYIYFSHKPPQPSHHQHHQHHHMPTPTPSPSPSPEPPIPSLNLNIPNSNFNTSIQQPPPISQQNQQQQPEMRQRNSYFGQRDGGGFGGQRFGQDEIEMEFVRNQSADSLASDTPLRREAGGRKDGEEEDGDGDEDGVL